MPSFTTPMMQQYASIKEQYQDCMLLFRLGDFYELFMEDAKADLKELYDIERILSRLSVGLGTAIDLVSLKYSLTQAREIQKKLKGFSAPLLAQITKHIPQTIQKVAKLIEKTIVDAPPFDIKGGRLIQEGVNKELDRLRKIVHGGEEWLDRHH